MASRGMDSSRCPLGELLVDGGIVLVHQVVQGNEPLPGTGIVATQCLKGHGQQGAAAIQHHQQAVTHRQGLVRQEPLTSTGQILAVVANAFQVTDGLQIHDQLPRLPLVGGVAAQEEQAALFQLSIEAVNAVVPKPHLRGQFQAGTSQHRTGQAKGFLHHGAKAQHLKLQSALLLVERPPQQAKSSHPKPCNRTGKAMAGMPENKQEFRSS